MNIISIATMESISTSAPFQPLHAQVESNNTTIEVTKAKTPFSSLKVCFVTITLATFILCINILHNNNNELINSSLSSYHPYRKNPMSKIRHSRSLEQNNKAVSEVDDLNQTEILCDNEPYSAISDLSYTYYLETTKGSDVNSIIKQLESLILTDLSDALLFCHSTTTITDTNNNNRQRQRKKRKMQYVQSIERSYVSGEIDSVSGQVGEESGQSFLDSLIDDYSLKIVGISSMPDDIPSTKSTCIPATGRDCTVIIGALNLFLKDNADLATVRYATRYAIRDAMLNDAYISKIEGLEDVNYVGPRIIKPSQNIDPEVYDDYVNGSSGFQTQGRKSNMSRLEVVVIATLISTMVGLFGSFLLFKKVYSNQNCLAPCDGTGIDKDYIEDCHNLGVAPVGETVHNPTSPSGKSTKSRWNMDSVNSVSGSGVLSSIDENSISTSDVGSLYSGAVSVTTRESTALKSVGSLHSEQTMVISNARRNKNRTPSFGEIDDKENFAPSSTAEMI